MRGEQPWRLERARALRSRSSKAEARLWSALRNRQLGGLKFVRQLPIGPYFVDFACREDKIVVEVDGGTHSSADEIARDEQRAGYLRDQGFRVFRVANGNVYDNLAGVLDTLLAAVKPQE